MKATEPRWGKEELGRLGRRRGETHLDPHLCLLPPPPGLLSWTSSSTLGKAYFILDEFLMGETSGHFQEKSVLKAIEQADLLQEVRVRDSEEEEERTVAEGHPPYPGALHLWTPAALFPAATRKRPPFPVAFGPHAARLAAGPQALTAQGRR